MHEDDRVAALATIFACPAKVAHRLDACMREKRFAHREVVAHQGDDIAHCWLVIEGAAEILCIGAAGQEALLMMHGPGEMFGAFPEPTASRADILARGDLFTLRIATSDLVALARTHARLAAGLAAIFARQLDFVLDRMAARTTLTAAGRVYAELLRLAGAEGRITPPPVLTALALGVQTTRETASRAVAVLERRGIIRRDGEALVIVSRRLLEDLVV
ncbi:MAG: Crp/Fnr family transcriptional regulator [Alphaproteobacteria bacterium]|nr:MAG: Crp/Fnr family transcriptional regulator [Alphaproteobacteria bacterium]